MASKVTMHDQFSRSTSDGLLVDIPSPTIDFPSPPRRRKVARDGKHRVVTFKPVCDVVIIPVEKTESKAYSREDVQRFNRMMLRDLLRRETPTENAGDHLYDTIGLDCFLS